MPVKCFSLVLRCFAVVALLSTLTGCTPEEKAEAFALVQAATSNLIENRQLVEQFVRDVKANTDPADPAYAQTLESYMIARESYHRYLDDIASGDTSRHTKPLFGHSPVEANNTATAFIEDATRALRPSSLSLRGVPFQRGVVIPESLAADIRRLPKKARPGIVANIAPQARWRTWGDL